MRYMDVDAKDLIAILAKLADPVLNLVLDIPFYTIIDLLDFIQILEQFLEVEVVVVQRGHQVRYSFVPRLQTLCALLDPVLGLCIEHLIVEVIKRDASGLNLETWSLRQRMEVQPLVFIKSPQVYAVNERIGDWLLLFRIAATDWIGAEWL